jgi:nucleoside-diphosphate-sugar epimerase
VSAVLITGADGYLGALITRLYARQSAREVIAWLHAAGKAEFEAKRARLAARLGGDAARVRFTYGELRTARPFLLVDPAEVGLIVHAAAITRFNVSEELAAAVNVEGTVRLLQFAERCPRLEAIGVLSSIYASGLQEGVIEVVPFASAPEFANYYERSKWRSEQALAAYDNLPWRLFRIATVIADDESGRVAKHNAVHNTLRLLYRGLLSLVPGSPTTPLYFVTGDFVAGNVCELMARGADRAVYHLSPAQKASLTLDELLATAWETFERSPDFARRGLLYPSYVPYTSFERLAQGVSGFGGRVLADAIASVLPFAPQLYISKSVCNRKLVAAGTQHRLGDSRRLVRECCVQLAAAS